MKSYKNPLNNQRGVAIILAMFTVVIILFLVTEITYETSVEYGIHAQSISRLKAYYAAKSGVQLSLLRIKIYASLARTMAGKTNPKFMKMLDLVWSFPFMWPPVLGEDTLTVDQDILNAQLKESKMDATYSVQIYDEGSKIDVNDLASPSKALADSTKKLLVGIFENKKANDEEWARENEDLKFEEVINNMIDWVDGDVESLNGGDERRLYESLGETTERYPPNRAFRTVGEIRLVAGMTETVFDMLKDRITVYGQRAINPNYASPEVLKSIDKSMTDEVVNLILQRRDNPDNGGPFTNEQDFWSFVAQSRGNVPPEVQETLPLAFDAALNFRVVSRGEFANNIKEITVVVFDVSSVATAVAKSIIKSTPKPNDGSNVNPSPTNPQGNTGQPQEPLPKGPPRIVYWNER
jgi:general secretion pathway protein K